MVVNFTDDYSRPDALNGQLYSGPILIKKLTAIRTNTYQKDSACSHDRSHSFIYPADVFLQDHNRLSVGQHRCNHAFGAEDFDLSNAGVSADEMVAALIGLQPPVISASYDSSFEIAGIQRG